jgi:hypothetical protein
VLGRCEDDLDPARPAHLDTLLDDQLLACELLMLSEVERERPRGGAAGRLFDRADRCAQVAHAKVVAVRSWRPDADRVGERPLGERGNPCSVERKFLQGTAVSERHDQMAQTRAGDRQR